MRAAAIAFALGADSIPALADDDLPEALPNSSAQVRAAGRRSDAVRNGQSRNASLTLEPRWRGVPDPAAQLRLLDGHGHKLLQSPVHGHCSFGGLQAGPCTLLVKTSGHTTLHRMELIAGRTIVLELEMDA